MVGTSVMEPTGSKTDNEGESDESRQHDEQKNGMKKKTETGLWDLYVQFDVIRSRYRHDKPD